MEVAGRGIDVGICQTDKRIHVLTEGLQYRCGKVSDGSIDFPNYRLREEATKYRPLTIGPNSLKSFRGRSSDMSAGRCGKALIESQW